MIKDTAPKRKQEVQNLNDRISTTTTRNSPSPIINSHIAESFSVAGSKISVLLSPTSFSSLQSQAPGTSKQAVVNVLVGRALVIIW